MYCLAREEGSLYRECMCGLTGLTSYCDRRAEKGSKNSATEAPWDLDWNEDKSLSMPKFYNRLSLVEGGTLWIVILVPLVFAICLAFWCRDHENKEQSSSSQPTQRSAATR